MIDCYILVPAIITLPAYTWASNVCSSRQACLLVLYSAFCPSNNPCSSPLHTLPPATVSSGRMEDWAAAARFVHLVRRSPLPPGNATIPVLPRHAIFSRRYLPDSLFPLVMVYCNTAYTYAICLNIVLLTCHNKLPIWIYSTQYRFLLCSSPAKR